MDTAVLWFGPTDFVSGHPSLELTHHARAVAIKATYIGNDKWIYLELKVPFFHEIRALIVCYRVSNSGSFIAQNQLVEVQRPDLAVVRHDDGTGLQSQTYTCDRISLSTAFRPDGAVTLGLRLNFADVSHLIILGSIGVEVNQVLTWNPLFQRPELRGPISFSPGKALRSDTGFVHYGGNSLDWDFHTNPYTPGPWDPTRSTTAAWRILSNLTLPRYDEFTLNSRFLRYNPYGIYATALSIIRTSRASPPGSVYAQYAGTMYWDADLITEEELFVHFGGGVDPAHRVVWASDSNRFLMKFDAEYFFDKYLVPLIDNVYRDYPHATGGPAIFVDNCPGVREYWSNLNDGWDHFVTNEAFFAGWQQVFRRIKSKYPNLKIMANWIPDNRDDDADRVLELVDHILFENFYGEAALKWHLAYAYRAQQMGKGVTFSALPTEPQGTPLGSEPTLEDYSRKPSPDENDYLNAYFCIFLLTWGENSHWGGRWYVDPGPSSKIHDLAVLRMWFGVPAAGENGTNMWEMRPDLWTRNFVNAKVFLNVSDPSDPKTYTIPMSGAVDENGAPVRSIELKSLQGQFVFRQGPPNGGFPPYAEHWRQLPNLWSGNQAYPYSISCDAIVSSLNLGVGESNENWVSHSEDLTADAWSKDGATTVTKGSIWNGIQMYDVENSSSDSLPTGVRYLINYGSSLATMHITIMCYTQQLDPVIQLVYLVIDGINVWTFHPLKWGDYPQLIASSIEVPGTFADSSFAVAIGGAPYGTKGKFRIGGVRVLIASDPDNPAIGEYIRTTGSPLMRGEGAGIGLPVSLTSLSGYLRPSGRPQLPLLNSTQIVGLAAGNGTTLERPALGINDVGYQYFDTSLGMPLWWSGTQWLKADSTPA